MPTFPKLFQSVKPKLQALSSRSTSKNHYNEPDGPLRDPRELGIPRATKDPLAPESKSDSLPKSFVDHLELQSYSDTTTTY